MRLWLTVAVWAGWFVLAGGAGVARTGPGDRVDDRGTRVLADVAVTAALVGSIAAAALLPHAALGVDPWIAFGVGTMLVVLGVALRLWAAHTLGRFFTQSVAVREGHRVVSAGPYRFVRHPGYTGMLVSLIGLAVMLDNWLGVLVVIVGFFVGHLPRILVEEHVLENALGEKYRSFERTHKRLIPGVW